MAEDKSRGFTVTDRRSFAGNGEARPEPAREPVPEPSDAAGAPAPSPPAEPAEAGSSRARPAADSGRRLPPVDFPTFVLSLGSSALIHLGEAPDPDGEPRPKDLAMAKHSIDLLSMLEEKTKGNLNATEAQLLENLLFDLRLRYVSATKSK